MIGKRRKLSNLGLLFLSFSLLCVCVSEYFLSPKEEAFGCWYGRKTSAHSVLSFNWVDSDDLTRAVFYRMMSYTV